MMQTTTTGAMSAPGTASLAITNASVIAGTASLPVYGLAATGTVAGAFLTAAPNFVGTWQLVRHTSGMEGSIPVQEICIQGDQNWFDLTGAGAVSNLTSLDTLTLTVMACVAGSVSLSVVQ